MALTKITGQVINDTTGLVVGVTTVGGGISATDGFFSGIVTAVGDASFSGNVSVGGTLTYEDVTNIDAVGLITARNGVVVGSGITLSKDGDGFFTGVVTATSYAGDGSGLTGIAATDNVRTGILDVAGVGTFRNDVNIPDKIIHLGDTNTTIRFPSADTITAETGGSERVRIDSNGKILAGATSSRTVAGGDAKLQVEATSSEGVSITRTSADGGAVYLSLGKTRNGSACQAGDTIGSISWNPDDGTDLNHAAAEIQTLVESGIGGDDVPGALVFKTNGGATTTTERMRISKEGYITKPNLPCFQVNGNPSSSNFSGYDNSWHSFANVVHNNGSHYSNSTGRFTAPVNGFYHFTAGLWSSNSDSTTGAYVMTIVRQDSDGSNSTSIAGANHVTERNQLAAAGGTYMTTGQTVRVSYNGSIVSSTPRNYFTGHLVG